MNNIVDDEPLVPWYRQGWPWFLISIPLVSVVLGIVMITLSLTTNNSLVVDDYYKEGKAINQRIERDLLATRLGLAANISFQSDEGTVLSLSRKASSESSSEMTWPDALAIRLVHVTEAKLDQSHRFTHLGGGRYLDENKPWPEQGRWRIHVQPGVTPDWRLVSETIVIDDKQDILLRANRAVNRDG